MLRKWLRRWLTGLLREETVTKEQPDKSKQPVSEEKEHSDLDEPILGWRSDGQDAPILGWHDDDGFRL